MEDSVYERNEIWDFKDYRDDEIPFLDEMTQKEKIEKEKVRKKVRGEYIYDTDSDTDDMDQEDYEEYMNFYKRYEEIRVQ